METRFEVKFKETVEAFCLGFEDIHLVNDGGYERGYAEGHDVGFAEGENVGYANGYEVGEDNGYKNGLTEGEQIGYGKGETVGYENGYTEGDAKGYERGYDVGYDKGVADTTPSGEIELTENKTYDVAQYASAKVAVVSKSKLPSVIDRSVTEITAEDLAGCTKIGTYAFYGATKLTSIELPSTVKQISNMAFESVTNLSKVIVPSLEYWCGLSLSYNRTNPLETNGKPMLYVNDTPVTDVVVPNGTALGNYTFYRYEWLKSLVIDVNPSSNMCEKCSNLTSVIFGENVTNTGYQSFVQTGIKSVVLPKSITSLGYYTFQQCLSLESVVIQGAPKQSGSYTFQGCKALTSVELGKSLEVFQHQFNGCSALPNIVIPKSVWRIGANAFYNCSALEYVDLTDYGSYEAFPSLNNISAFTSAGTNTSVGTFEIRVPAGRKAELSAMTNWSTYADKIVEVGEEPSVPAWTPTEGLGYSLSSRGNSYVCTGIGTATKTDITVAIKYNGMLVTEIKERAFENNRTITSIVLPPSIKTINDYAIMTCSNLTSASLNEGLTTLGARVFENLSKLTEIHIPSTVNSIGIYCFASSGLVSMLSLGSITEIPQGTFYECYSLKNVIIPNTVTTIGNTAFWRCLALEYIDLTGYGTDKPMPILDATAFSGCPSTFQIRVPSGRKAELAAMTNWSAYADNIVEV